MKEKLLNIPLTFGYSKGSSLSQNSQELVNMMVEIDLSGGSEKYYLRGTPGLKLWLDTGIHSEIRLIYRIAERGLVVVGNQLWEFDFGTKRLTLVGNFFTSSGFIDADDNPTQVLFVDGTRGYIYNKSAKTLTAISNDVLSRPTTVSFIGSCFIVTTAGTGLFYKSALNDGLTWDALDYATAEYRPDTLVSCFVDHEELILLGTNTIEWWRVNTDSFPLAKIPGSTQEIGLGAKRSVAAGENVLFFLDNHGLVRMVSGYTPTIISQDIQDQISKWSQITDAFGFTMVEQGKTYFVLTSPSAGQTFVYSLETQKWHRRASFPDNGRWRANCCMQEGPMVLVGDFENGKIYQLDDEYYWDDDQPIKWVAGMHEVKSKGNNRILHHFLRLHVESGIGLITGQGEDALMWLTYSDDGGKTWSNERYASMGKIGEYNKLIQWRQLGVARQRYYRFQGSDPVKRVIISAILSATPCLT